MDEGWQRKGKSKGWSQLPKATFQPAPTGIHATTSSACGDTLAPLEIVAPHCTHSKSHLRHSFLTVAWHSHRMKLVASSSRQQLCLEVSSHQGLLSALALRMRDALSFRLCKIALEFSFPRPFLQLTLVIWVSRLYHVGHIPVRVGPATCNCMCYSVLEVIKNRVNPLYAARFATAPLSRRLLTLIPSQS